MNPPEENGLDYERGDSDVSRHYRELHTAVPAALDEAILARAREDMQRSNRSRRWRKWTAPFALAASAVLALSILFRAGTERETLITQQAPQAASALAGPVVQVPSDQPSEPSTERESSATSERDEVPTASIAAQSASGQSASEQSAAPSVSLRASDHASALEEPIRKKLEESPSSASAAAGQQFAMTQEERVAPPVPAALAIQIEVNADAVAQQTVASAPAAEGPKKVAAKIDSAQAAEHWLKEIRKLRAQGRIREANKQWSEFRKTFPDYTVAADDAARPKP